MVTSVFQEFVIVVKRSIICEDKIENLVILKYQVDFKFLVKRLEKFIMRLICYTTCDLIWKLFVVLFIYVDILAQGIYSMHFVTMAKVDFF